MKKIKYAVLLLLCLSMPFNAYALEKDEVVNDGGGGGVKLEEGSYELVEHSYNSDDTLTCSYGKYKLQYDFKDQTGAFRPTIIGLTDNDSVFVNSLAIEPTGDRTCPSKLTITGKAMINYSESYPKIGCGDDVIIPFLAPRIVSIAITILQIATPIIIIILGSLDLMKAVAAQKEDDIKKGQQIFFKRLLVGSAVFLVFALVKVGIGIVAPHDDENKNMWDCVDCFVTGDCDSLLR